MILTVLAPVTLASTNTTAIATASSGWLHTEGRWIKNGQGMIVGLYGVNTYVRLQNEWLKFVSAKSYGFDTIRLGFWKYDIEHPTSDDPNVDKSGVDAIDRAVSWSTSLGLKVILDQHLWGPYGGNEYCWPAPGEFLSNTVLQQQWLDMWRLLVDRYKNNPTVVGIDIMNEPYMMGRPESCPASKEVSVSNPWSVWEGIAKNAVADLKTHNPNLLFIVEGWANDHPWNDIAFLKQGNVVLSNHIYHHFAKDWDDWGKAYASGNLVTGKQLLAKWIDDNYMVYVNQGIPFWVGETGFLTSDPYWQQQMADELKLFDDRNLSYSAYVHAVSAWNEPFDLIDHSTSSYNLTIVGRMFASHLLALQHLLRPTRRTTTYSIFSVGFESGDFTAWNGGTFGTVSVVSNPVHSGAKAAKATYSGSASGWQESLASSYADLYFRSYIYVPALPSVGKSSIIGIVYNAAWNEFLQSMIYTDANGSHWILVCPNGWQSDWAPAEVSANTWYSVEIRRFVGDATHGQAELWVNGSLLVDSTQAITGNSQNLQAGSIAAGDANFIVYGDDFVADSSYIPQSIPQSVADTMSNVDTLDRGLVGKRSWTDSGSVTDVISKLRNVPTSVSDVLSHSGFVSVQVCWAENFNRHALAHGFACEATECSNSVE